MLSALTSPGSAQPPISRTHSLSDAELETLYQKLPVLCEAGEGIPVGRSDKVFWNAHEVTLSYQDTTLISCIASGSPDREAMDNFWDLVGQFPGYIVNLGNAIAYLGMESKEATASCPLRQVTLEPIPPAMTTPEHFAYRVGSSQVAFNHNNNRIQLPALEVTNWPGGKGLPPEQLHHLVIQMNQLACNTDSKGIIHCHYGIGRTGVLIVAAALSQLHQQQLLSAIELPAILSELIRQARRQRSSWFIETPEQYKALYRYGEWLCSAN
ncbi:protein-tyrosine phosphatase family protein [Parendozoicomonas haliclonae]|uniref:protein-tyrosine phosphatase family protein n=1 Tax=Parendozoicomonas haliclonae TaxID=1960125 RepID=UPI0013FD4032|nr:protein-tyrosine phosphatase family protein [Parendozoicomonas haliclonae]